MTLQEYMKNHRGKDLAAAIGVTPVLVSQWANGVRRVPADRCPSIERATYGKVRCEELRADVDWAVLRSSPASYPETPRNPATAAGRQAGGEAMPGNGASAAAMAAGIGKFSDIEDDAA